MAEFFSYTWILLVLWCVFFGVFILPRILRGKAAKDRLAEIQPGDRVVLGQGRVAEVVEVRPATFIVKFHGDRFDEVLRSAVTEVL